MKCSNIDQGNDSSLYTYWCLVLKHIQSWLTVFPRSVSDSNCKDVDYIIINMSAFYIHLHQKNEQCKFISLTYACSSKFEL